MGNDFIMDVFTPPRCDTEEPNDKMSVFLAGTIDNGGSNNWQSEVIRDLTLNHDGVEGFIKVYNPRRRDWPTDGNKTVIIKQIDWELDHLEKSDLIVMNILSGSRSPVSMMELGLFSKSKKIIVFCNDGFYRYDNIRMVCTRYDIPLYSNNSPHFVAEKIKNFMNERNKQNDLEEVQ